MSVRSTARTSFNASGSRLAILATTQAAETQRPVFARISCQVSGRHNTSSSVGSSHGRWAERRREVGGGRGLASDNLGAEAPLLACLFSPPPTVNTPGQLLVVGHAPTYCFSLLLRVCRLRQTPGIFNIDPLQTELAQLHSASCSCGTCPAIDPRVNPRGTKHTSNTLHSSTPGTSRDMAADMDIDMSRRNKRARPLSEHEKEKLDEFIDAIHYSARCVFTLLPRIVPLLTAARYSDESYEYRHVQLPKQMLKAIPKDYFDGARGTLKLLWEDEWRALGITQVCCQGKFGRHGDLRIAESGMGALRGARTGASHLAVQVSVARGMKVAGLTGMQATNQLPATDALSWHRPSPSFSTFTQNRSFCFECKDSTSATLVFDGPPSLIVHLERYG
jgi:cyclin-dependent kinase regulatory subunit CKS1